MELFNIQQDEGVHPELCILAHAIEERKSQFTDKHLQK